MRGVDMWDWEYKSPNWLLILSPCLITQTVIWVRYFMGVRNIVEIFGMQIDSAIVSSVITALAAIFVGYLAYKLDIKKIIDKLGTIKSLADNLNGEHGKRKSEHSDLSKEHLSIIHSIDKNIVPNTEKILNTVTSLDKQFIEEKTKQEYRYLNLNDGQKTIVDSIKNLDSFSFQFQQLAIENKLLNQQVLNLQRENSKLNERIMALENRLEEEQEY
jgi:hypothetical protein